MNEIDEKQQVFHRQLGGKFTNSFLFIIQIFFPHSQNMDTPYMHIIGYIQYNTKSQYVYT